ncbi:MAG: TonB-dependent receptor [Acidobacteria bacterium]|nr:TonB-dependent receptor [Acidobacteriota bacterium]
MEAASPVLIEGSRVAITDGTGRYNIIALLPGTYTVTMTLPGFSTFVQEGIQVPAATNVTINGSLSVGALEETVTVSGEAPIVDVQSAARVEVVEREVLDSLPTTRNTQSIGYLAQGVRLTRPDVGGAQMMEQVRMSVHGATPRHTTMQVDGMIVNSQMGDGLIMNYNNQALSQEMAMTTSGNNAEVQAGGLRLNMIPKDGGNQFSGTNYVGFTLNESWQADNFTQGMQDLGLTSNQGVTNIHDVNPAIGGPILRDRLWYFTSARAISVDELFAGAFQPTLRTDVSPEVIQDYFKRGARITCEDPNTSTGCVGNHPAIAGATRAVSEQHVRSVLARLTAQVSQRNKVSAYLDRIFKWKKREFDANREPIQAAGFRDPGQANYHTFQAKWTSTISSRALLEVGYSQVYERLLIASQTEEALREVFPDNIPLPNLRAETPGNLRTCIQTPCYWDAGYNQTGPWYANAVIGDRGTGLQTNNYWGDIWITPSDRFYPNAAFSYVTGSHNFKVGMQWSFGNDGDTRNRLGHINIRPYNGLPVPCDPDPSVDCEARHFVTALNYPTSWNTTVRADRGIYVQDTWTVDRLTINAGLRWDHFESLINTFRTGDLPGGRFINARSAPEIPATPYWDDITPRLSVTYDLFGDARTALKFSANKFMRPYASGHAERYSPYREVGDNRAWYDCALNPAVHMTGEDGDPRAACATAADLGGLPASPEHYLSTNYDGIAQDHEIGLLGNSTVFREGGVAVPSSRPADDLQREYNWEYNVGIQHELLPRVSLNVGWYRRVFADIEARSNTLLQSCNVATAQAGVPCGSWIPFAVNFDDPDGHVARLRALGQDITIPSGQFLAFDLDPAYRGLVNNLDVTSDINRNYYNGFEVSMNARLPNGGNIFGGWTASQHIQDTCGLIVNPNGVSIEDPIRGADEGITRGGRWCDQSTLGMPFRHDFKLFATYPLPYDFEVSGSIQAYSGGERELTWSLPASYSPTGSFTSTPTVQLFQPGTNFLPYWTQVDVSLRRLFRFNNIQASVQADLYNALNAAVQTDENETYGGAWGRPTRLLQGRILRTAFQLNW